MGFLVITCIEPVDSLLGCISLRISILFMAFLLFACASYSLAEANIFFEDQKFFGVINKYILFVIQVFMGALVGLDFFVKKKCYTRLLYYLSFLTAGFSLVYNVFKISIFNDKVNDDYGHDHKVLQLLFVIRVIGEFLVEMIVCYYCYSYKKKL